MSADDPGVRSEDPPPRNALPMPDRRTLEERLGRLEATLYRITSITSAAVHAVRNIEGGEGSDVDGCLQVARDLLDEACRQVDAVNLLAPAGAQEVRP